MTQEEKELLLKDLCARLLYGVICTDNSHGDSRVFQVDVENEERIYYTDFDEWGLIKNCKPYLRPLSSMTDEEAMEVAELWGLEDILSISVKENYISVELCDGVAMSETYTIWFNEIVASIKLFDWLNAHHFDYRGLIDKELALEAPEDMYKLNKDEVI